MEEKDLITRLKETDTNRSILHRKLKRRYQEAKNKIHLQKKQIERLERDLQWSQYRERQANKSTRYWKNIVESGAFSSGSYPHQNLPNNTPHLLEKMAWRYPMRLGVLFQHEPRPLQREAIPLVHLDHPPKISIVTPSFNQGIYLERTLCSVLDQDYPNLEYIVMDGGSSDESPEIIEQYAPSLHYWQSQPDGGHSAALKAGFARSSGEIMAWLNSDDLYLPGALAYVAHYFATHPEIDAVYGHRINIDHLDRQVGRWTMPPHDPDLLPWEDYIPQETLFWRRSLFEKAGGMDSQWKFAMDWDLLLRLQRAGGRFRRLPYFLGCFRIHEEQKSIAQVDSVGASDREKIWQRELGDRFDPFELKMRQTRAQLKASFTDRLLRMGIRL